MNTSLTVSSLRVQLALAFGALAAALAVVLSLVLGHYASNLARNQIGLYLTRLSIEYRDKLDTSLSERMDEVQMLAQLDVALPDAATPERRRARIEQLMHNRDYAWIGYVSSTGRVAIGADGLLEGSDVSARPWFRASRERPALLGVHDGTVLSSALPAARAASRFVDLAVPIGRDHGVVAALLDFSWAARLGDDIEAYAKRGSSFELLLTEPDGKVLLGPPDLIGKKVPLPLGVHVGAPAAIEQWPDGLRYLVGGSASRGLGAGLDPGWISIARQRVDVAFAPVSALQRAILWAGLALALAGIGTGWLLAARLARPLELLAAAAGDIAAGKHRAVLPRLDNNREVTRLSEALRAMLAHLREQAETLRGAQDQMEHRVRERTAELIKAQAQLELEIADTMVARDDVSKAREQLEFALNASNLVLWDYDVPGDRIFLGPAWSQMLGGPARETRCSSQELLALVPEPERALVLKAVQNATAGTTAEYRVEHPVERKDGKLLWIVSVGRVIEREADGRARRIIGTNRDITERIEAQRKVEALALHDALTGLPNRRLLDDRLQVALASARRENRPLGLLFIDLDGVAPDTEAGNAQLLELTRRARAALRETDTFARVGGHEFVAVLPGAGAEVMTLPASRLLKALSLPVEIAGRSTSVVASIGAAQAAVGAEEPADLLARANARKEEARRAGHSNIRIDPDPVGPNEIPKEKRP